MTSSLPIAALALLALNLLLLLWLLLRRADEAPLRRLEDGLRGELARQAQAARADLGSLQQLLLAQGGEVARTQNEQIDAFRTQLASTQAQTEAALRRFSDTLAEQLQRLSEANERRLLALQEGNEKKLDQMRATVDEKLQATLEQRLGASFKQVADRLEQVHKGLGEMQSLARDVGSLNRVLTNVKTRGVFGEVQLAALLEQVFTPEQYGTHVATVPGSSERVEFAIRLPGRGAAQGAGSDAPLWLPIDAKFPREDYERLLDAAERADAPAAEAAGKAIEQRLRLEARTIREKYVAPPHTTDFAILFVPTEGLYAEALRRPGLAEALQREHKVMLAGPTTLLALLNSLQMGFRTLVLEKRSAEVWEVLGAVKTEFGKFGEVLVRTRKKLEEASNTIDLAETRTRAMARQLRSVEALPEGRSAQLLAGLSAEAADAPD
ncbi:MAG: DNA recombination protein RmuC [Burkholderiales bacterium]|nr:DNA recombination protein RmuC [Burkholderiales bacterium]MDE2566203.1 DNA recombination protein RmuC [Burkholderiales bacterium]